MCQTVVLRCGAFFSSNGKRSLYTVLQEHQLSTTDFDHAQWNPLVPAPLCLAGRCYMQLDTLYNLFDRLTYF